MLQIYNTLTRKKEELKAIKDKKIGMYVCGPTVYGPSHLGHARTYIIFDFIRRFLEFSKYKVKFIMNITDIHDDILREAKRLKISPNQLAEKYSKEFFNDLETLKIKKSLKNPRVSDSVKEIINLIKILIKKNCAYKTKDGVYFRISSLKNYGSLSGRKIEQTLTGTRVKTDKYEKEEATDFALWKITPPVAAPSGFVKLEHKEIPEEKTFDWVFDSPWGKGRPGWHIECSAMSKKYLGIPFDIHGGAIDLIFPHHENEIAQSESAFNKKLANYFLHSGLLFVDGKKMSKSLKNFTTINEFLLKQQFTHSPRFLRFFIFSHHWRSVIDLNEKTLLDAFNNFVAINEFITKLKINGTRNKKQETNKIQTEFGENFEYFKQKFIAFLEDDFNSARAINYLLKFIKKVESQNEFNPELLKILKEFDKFFICFFPWTKIDSKTNELIKQRETLRIENKYNESDEIRNQLQKQGIILQDEKEKTLIVNLN